MTDIRTTLRAQVQARREALGLTWPQVAERLGAADYEHARELCCFTHDVPTVRTLTRIAAALDCELNVQFTPKEHHHADQH